MIELGQIREKTYTNIQYRKRGAFHEAYGVIFVRIFDGNRD